MINFAYITTFLSVFLISSSLALFYRNIMKLNTSNAGSPIEKNIIIKLLSPLVPFFLRFNKKMGIERALSFYTSKLDKIIVRAGGVDVTPEQILAMHFSGLVVGTAIALVSNNIVGKISFLIIPMLSFYPFIWINDLATKRIESIVREFPYALDLLTMCVEAGLDFGQAMMKVVGKIKPGNLRDEFLMFLREIRMGMTRREALQRLADRVGHQDIVSFSMALIQSDVMGTPLSKTLKTISEQMRTTRVQRAETKAAQAPVKMMPALLLFFFPATFIIIFVPIAIRYFIK